jgi:hypothetical protein
MALVVTELSPRRVSLKEIYLDPNNPRFLRESPVDEDRISEEGIQQNTLEKMQELGIDQLKENIRAVGFLKIDRIVVRPLKQGGYVVLEGNRRVAALKLLIHEHYSEGRTLPPNILKTVENIEVLVYEGTGREPAWFFQGLRSIGGLRDWPAYQKAKFIAARIDEDGMTLTDVAKSFGITSHQAGAWYRSYHGFQQLRSNEEYGTNFGYDKFTYLAEGVFTRKCTALRDWLGWDDDERKFTNEQSMSRFLEMLLPSEGEEAPRITRGIDLRDYVCVWAAENPDFFTRFVTGRQTLDQAREELSRMQAEIRAESEVGLDQYVNAMKELLSRMPRIPLVEAHERKEEVLELYQKILDQAKAVIEILSSGETGSAQAK